MPILLAAMLTLAGHACAGAPELGIQGHCFTLDGKPTFLLGISYYGGLGASDATLATDLDAIAAAGFNWIRVWALWDAFGQDLAVVGPTGRPRPRNMARLIHLVQAAGRRGLVVDVTLHRGGVIKDQNSHLCAALALARALKGQPNVYLDLANERDVRDDRFVSFEDLRAMRDAVKAIDPRRLLTASGEGDPKDYLIRAGLDFMSPHRPRDPSSPDQTEAATRAALQRMARLGLEAPIHYQEPFRRDYGPWQPQVDDFRRDLQGAVRGGAAGWCLHNGSPRGRGNEQTARPRRSFDLRDSEGPLIKQLDQVEKEVFRSASKWARLAASDM